MSLLKKHCRVCHLDLPMELFPRRGGLQGGRIARCVDCERTRQRDRAARETTKFRRRQTTLVLVEQSVATAVAFRQWRGPVTAQALRGLVL